jgi:hypothetical protein
MLQTIIETKWYVWAVAITALFFGAQFAGEHMGRAHAKKDKARLDSIWPGVMTMHHHDREALAATSLLCELNKLPDDAATSEVFACLRRGAAKLAEREPSSPVPLRLERLIRQSGV